MLTSIITVTTNNATVKGPNNGIKLADICFTKLGNF